MLPNIAFCCGEGCNSHTHTLTLQAMTQSPKLSGHNRQRAVLSLHRLLTELAHQRHYRHGHCVCNAHTQHSSLVQGQGVGCGTENNTSKCDMTWKSRLNQGDAERPSAADYLPLHHGLCFQFTVPEVVMVFWYPGNDIYLPASQGDAVKGIHVLLLTSTKEYVGKGVQVEITLKVCWSRYPGGDTNPRSVLQTVSRCWYSLVYGVYWRSI